MINIFFNSVCSRIFEPRVLGRHHWRLRLRPGLVGLLAAVLHPAFAAAETLNARVINQDGEPVADAVVYFPEVRGEPEATPTAVVDQEDKEFIPYVTVVRAGTEVDFPNRDNIRHHVYSFSESKSFELPLYKGRSANPVIFEQTGVVPLGCNIHDWMQAYIFVTESRHFGVTDARGRVQLPGVPSGRQRVQVWHPALATAPADTAKTLDLANATTPVTFSIPQKRLWSQWRAPQSGFGGY